MKFLFFLVTGNKAYKDGLGFHQSFFEQSGFMWGIIIAAAIAIIIAAIFYFGLTKNITLAKRPNWWICLLIVAIATFFVSDFMVIGGNGSTNEMTFYQANENYVKSKKRDPKIKQYTEKKVKIRQELKKWNDVRLPFDLNCAIWGCIVFVAGSAVMKRYSVNATQIPW